MLLYLSVAAVLFSGACLYYVGCAILDAREQKRKDDAADFAEVRRRVAKVKALEAELGLLVVQLCDELAALPDSWDLYGGP